MRVIIARRNDFGAIRDRFPLRESIRLRILASWISARIAPTLNYCLSLTRRDTSPPAIDAARSAREPPARNESCTRRAIFATTLYGRIVNVSSNYRASGIQNRPVALFAHTNESELSGLYEKAARLYPAWISHRPVMANAGAISVTPRGNWLLDITARVSFSRLGHCAPVAEIIIMRPAAIFNERVGFPAKPFWRGGNFGA